MKERKTIINHQRLDLWDFKSFGHPNFSMWLPILLAT
jgi:hypothetical protein